MEGFKIGHETGKKGEKESLEIIKKLIPNKVKDLYKKVDCFYSVTDDRNPILKMEDNIVYATGFNGRGFKFMPLYGEMVLDLLKGGKEIKI